MLPVVAFSNSSMTSFSFNSGANSAIFAGRHCFLRENLNLSWYNTQLSSEGEVNSGGYIPRREASRYISTALHRS